MIEPPPRSFIAGAAYLIARNGPIRLTRRISAQSLGILLENAVEPAGNAGIGEEDVEPAMVADGMRDQRGRPAPRRPRRIRSRRREVGADHRRAFAAEQLDARLADAGAGAGDDRDFVCAVLVIREG